MKKCQPGVICIENVTFFVIFVVILIIYLIYTQLNKPQKQNINVNNHEKIIINDAQRENAGAFGFGFIPSYPFTNLGMPKNVLLDPYAPPLRDERYYIPELNRIPPGTVPINVSTNIGAVDTNYRQVGILTPLNGTSKNNILSLMARPLFTNRDKWQYYTISNQHNNVKLPLSRNGKSCTNEYGCDKLYDGDTIYVEGYNEPFKATIYDNDTIKYLPFI
jgi:hypothetical protein